MFLIIFNIFNCNVITWVFFRQCQIKCWLALISQNKLCKTLFFVSLGLASKNKQRLLWKNIFLSVLDGFNKINFTKNQEIVVVCQQCWSYRNLPSNFFVKDFVKLTFHPKRWFHEKKLRWVLVISRKITQMYLKNHQRRGNRSLLSWKYFVKLINHGLRCFHGSFVKKIVKVNFRNFHTVTSHLDSYYSYHVGTLIFFKEML